jgi:5-methylthioadenosine/S-adenosylhomocysteine deaminase
LAISRRNFLLGSSAVAAAGALPQNVLAQASTPPSGELVLTGGHILSFDPTIGDLPQGDVHIRNGQIIAVAPSIAAPGVARRPMGGRIVMPGFVDTHWHMWNSVARGFGNTRLGPFAKSMGALSRAWTPEASALSVRLACAEAVQSGITTVNNWAHNIKARDFADAELDAQKASGLRGRFSYGYPQAIGKDVLMDLDGVEIMKKEEFGERNRSLVSLGLCARGPDRCEAAVWRGEWAAAREFKLPITTHIASDRAAGAMGGIARLHSEGLLGPDVLMVHATHARPEDLRLLAEAKSPLSISPWTELEVGYGLPPIAQMVDARVPMSLSVDNMVLAGQADMFSVMRLAVDLAAGMAEKQAALPDRAVLQWATMGGAEALGLGKTIGSLTAGKRADIIAVRTDAIGSSPVKNADFLLTHAARPNDVDFVMIDGVVHKDNGRLTRVDVPALLAESGEMIRRLRVRADL